MYITRSKRFIREVVKDLKEEEESGSRKFVKNYNYIVISKA